jgi:hypothetical protein
MFVNTFGVPRRRRIILFCDGTRQSPRNDSNVYRLYVSCIETHDQMHGDNVEQFPIYIDGVDADQQNGWGALTGSRTSKLRIRYIASSIQGPY